ncbi:MAG: biotin-dependent carboxyltransferase family protein [Granulosicoccus sp.]
MSETNAALNVVGAGLLSTVQDKGRFGLRHLGIPWAGALSPPWQAIANALVGNPADAPVIECFEGGLHLRACDHSVQLAVVGSDSTIIRLGRDDSEFRSQANRTFTLAAGDTFQLSSTGSYRHALVAVAGIDIPQHLNSTSTYAKAALGGLNGRALEAGDQVRFHPTLATSLSRSRELQCQLPMELRYEADELRAIAGPQFDHFSTTGVESFLSSEYELGVEADRMGVRLTGSAIGHRDAAARDIVSDAIVPGSIQVPGTGQPIVLLNDAHTAGGYPKIATVISSDLPLLGIQRAGAKFRFRLVDIDEAIAIRQHTQKIIERCIDSFSPCIVSDLDTRTLLSCNLIDGVTDGS